MERILRGEGDWQAAIAEALRRVSRPIPVDPRIAAREPQARQPGPARSRFPDRASLPAARRAATLLVLYPAGAERRGELVIPLTVRHPGLRAHAGEVSLPGGSIDPTDASPADAALREAWEELGIPPGDVRMLGSLDATWIPVSNFELRPFVGALPSAPALVAHEPEVEAVIELPARVLVEEGRLTEELIEGPDWQLLAGGYRHGAHLIWGATARTLGMFATVLRLAGELSAGS